MTTTTHQTEADLRTLALLADRWEQIAVGVPDPGSDFLVDEPTPAQAARTARAHTYRKAAADLRNTLRTGRLPHDLMTDAELERHAAPEETTR